MLNDNQRQEALAIARLYANARYGVSPDRVRWMQPRSGDALRLKLDAHAIYWDWELRETLGEIPARIDSLFEVEEYMTNP